MTATEVVQRTEEKMRLLGPVLGRLQAELLQPLITRVYNILERKQFFRVAPEFIQNNDISIEYVSPLAKAQRMGDVQSAMRLFELLGPVAQIDRGIMDYVDSDGLTKHMIRALSVPASAVRGDEEVVAIRQQRQARQEEQRQLAQAQQVAEAAGSAAPALKAAQGLGVV